MDEPLTQMVAAAYQPVFLPHSPRHSYFHKAERRTCIPGCAFLVSTEALQFHPRPIYSLRATTSRVSHTVKQELISTPIIVPYDFGRQAGPKPYLCTVWLRNPDLHSSHNPDSPVYSHLRAHHHCSFPNINPYLLQRGVESLFSLRPSNLQVTTHHRSCLSACVVLIAAPALESFPSLFLSQSHQLETWLSRLPISSSRLSRKVQRQSGQHQIPVSFSRPLGQKDATGRQSLALCSTSSLPRHSLRSERFRSTPSIGSLVSEH
jgi:hypothetical protein